LQNRPSETLPSIFSFDSGSAFFFDSARLTLAWGFPHFQFDSKIEGGDILAYCAKAAGRCGLLGDRRKLPVLQPITATSRKWG
jgi:hypothetical protein